MKTTIHAILTLLFLVSPTFAHSGGDFGGFGFGDFGGLGFGFGGDHRGFGGFGGDFGLGFFDAERTQTRFQDQLDSLQTKYNDGVANTTDFFTTSQYDRIVSKTELLDDRYGLFVSGVERNINRITDLISTTNDDITYFNNLLVDYQADTSLSSTRLDRIEAWINRITNRLSDRVDSLTNTQTTLQTNLPTYQTFQTTVDTFLSDIKAAGAGTTGDGTSSSLVSLASSPVSLTSRSMLMKSVTSNDEAVCAAGSMSLTPTAIPEPGTATLVLLALGAGFAMDARRWRRRR